MTADILNMLLRAIRSETGAPATVSTHDELVLRLRSAAMDVLASGGSKTELLAALLDFRTRAPEHDDVVLDVMDFIEGWSSPHIALNDPNP